MARIARFETGENRIIVRKKNNSLAVLYCTILYCIVLRCTLLYCIILYSIVLYCIVLLHFRLIGSLFKNLKKVPFTGVKIIFVKYRECTTNLSLLVLQLQLARKHSIIKVPCLMEERKKGEIRRSK